MSMFDRINRAAARRLPVKWVRSHLDRPVASISFDDFPRSAWTVGGPILARRQALATYYAGGDFCGRNVDGIDYFDDRRPESGPGARATKSVATPSPISTLRPSARRP